MMEHDSGWIDNSGEGVLQYDFVRPRHWTDARAAGEQAAIAASIERADAGLAVPGWLCLALRLPGPLRQALLAELRAGNPLAGIGSTGWPNDGSVVVKLRERFCVAHENLPDGVAWRRFDDPHYAREELSQSAGGIEFLIIC